MNSVEEAKEEVKSSENLTLMKRLSQSEVPNTTKINTSFGSGLSKSSSLKLTDNVVTKDQKRPSMKDILESVKETGESIDTNNMEELMEDYDNLR